MVGVFIVPCINCRMYPVRGENSRIRSSVSLYGAYSIPMIANSLMTMPAM